MIKIAPSILSCDFARLGEEAAAVKAAGAELLHVDIMDGHFVPNISLGLPVVASLRKATDMFLDCHLMVEHPGEYAERFIKAGADRITFHLEATCDPAELISTIHARGAQAGISLRPATPAETLLPFLEVIDAVLIMCVQPGYGGQSFNADMMAKLDEVRQMAARLGTDVIIEVDGGINADTAAIAAAHGADELVAGTAVFSQPDYAAAIRELRESALAARR